MTDRSGHRQRLRTHDQDDAYSSPWTLATRLRGGLWHLAWLLAFRPTPKPLRAWRVFLLRLFGARIRGTVFVDSTVTVRMPWNLRMDDRACLGPGIDVYNLAPVTLRARSTVARHVCLCTGTHDVSSRSLPLVTGPIEIGEDAFVGMRATILPGVRIAPGTVVGAGSVVTKDLPAWTVCAGNPCKPLGERRMRD